MDVLIAIVVVVTTLLITIQIVLGIRMFTAIKEIKKDYERKKKIISDELERILRQ